MLVLSVLIGGHTLIADAARSLMTYARLYPKFFQRLGQRSDGQPFNEWFRNTLPQPRGAVVMPDDVDAMAAATARGANGDAVLDELVRRGVDLADRAQVDAVAADPDFSAAVRERCGQWQQALLDELEAVIWQAAHGGPADVTCKNVQVLRSAAAPYATVTWTPTAPQPDGLLGCVKHFTQSDDPASEYARQFGSMVEMVQISGAALARIGRLFADAGDGPAERAEAA
jgi:hypothetical protein